MLMRRRKKIASFFDLIFSIHSSNGSTQFQLTLNKLIIFIIFFLFCGVEFLAEAKKKKLKEQDIIQRVLKDYDWRVRPRGNNDTWPGKKFVLIFKKN